MTETWYVLEDGTAADPADVVSDSGRLRHADGRYVAMRFGDVPSTRSIDPAAERAKVAMAAVMSGDISADEAREISGLPKVESKPARVYSTRDMKARR